MKDLGRMIKQQRVAAPLTLRELANTSGVSASHLGRIERGERFPSARILKRIAKPLGFQEKELFTLAEFLSPVPSDGTEEESGHTISGLDRHVARVLAREPFEVQRCVVRILSTMKILAESLKRE